MDRLRRSYNMVMFLLLGLICGISGSLLDKPILTPVLYVCCALCGLIFSGLVFSPVKKGFDN
ncbi:hypothetical protein GCM10008904_19640 [Paraclostridium ghonii]|uniref:Uncharacterized protein n=1 Tax=Paraclostridium ghonii TaxID=29358 RepID=A0ABU0MX95_9FIRM|nr:hypothetical protein [Paeniclostridium ghonii]MCM0165150.1 hypothetical protein [Paeniclostridium ghonii]MDQ0555218.1 hypothetical protein [Paeniclostridium ghonii]